MYLGLSTCRTVLLSMKGVTQCLPTFDPRAVFSHLGAPRAWSPLVLASIIIYISLEMWDFTYRSKKMLGRCLCLTYFQILLPVELRRRHAWQREKLSRIHNADNDWSKLWTRFHREFWAIWLSFTLHLCKKPDRWMNDMLEISPNIEGNVKSPTKNAPPHFFFYTLFVSRGETINLPRGGLSLCPFFSHQPTGKRKGESALAQKS